MSKQRELFRTSILAQMYGGLVLIGVDPSIKGVGKCPMCGAVKFIKDWWSKGWTSCDNEQCDFQMLTSHVEEVASQWE